MGVHPAIAYVYGYKIENPDEMIMKIMNEEGWASRETNDYNQIEFSRGNETVDHGEAIGFHQLENSPIVFVQIDNNYNAASWYLGLNLKYLDPFGETISYDLDSLRPSSEDIATLKSMAKKLGFSDPQLDSEMKEYLVPTVS